MQFSPLGLRERKKEATRVALVDAAERLFGERGVEATTMDDVAREANTSRTSVFNYFPYKEALLVEIGARWVQEIAASMGQVTGRRTVRATMTALADHVASFVERDPALAASVAREVTHPDPRRRRYAMVRMQYPVLYEHLIQQLAAEGRLRHPHWRPSLHRQLLDLTMGVVIRAGGDYPVEQVRTEFRRNIDLFFDGAVASGQ
jgi:AcrR family transcriptional regulator